MRDERLRLMENIDLISLVSRLLDISRNGSVARCERGIEKHVITVNWKIFSVSYRLKALKFALPIQMFLYSFESRTARGLSLPRNQDIDCLYIACGLYFEILSR